MRTKHITDVTLMIHLQVRECKEMEAVNRVVPASSSIISGGEEEEHIEYEDEDFDMDFDFEYKCNERRDQMAELLSLYLILGRFLGWPPQQHDETNARHICTTHGNAIFYALAVTFSIVDRNFKVSWLDQSLMIGPRYITCPPAVPP